MYSDPTTWHRLCETFSENVAEYLLAQIEAGVQAVQLFDSWVGALNASDYREFILPHTQRILSTVSGKGVPVLHFGTNTSDLLEIMSEAGGDVIGVDWRIPIDHAWKLIGNNKAIQGNLDPTLLLGPPERMLASAQDILQ